MERSGCRASSSLSMADSPSSGWAECAALPRATTSTRNAPLEASAMRLPVGSPLTRKREPRGFWLATAAPSESRSSPATNSSPAGTPSSCKRSTAATWAAMMPLASHEPRPKIRVASSPRGDERRHAVGVRGKYDGGRGSFRPVGKEIEAPGRDRHALDGQAGGGEVSCEERRHRALIAGGAFDIDQLTGKGDRVHGGENTRREGFKVSGFQSFALQKLPHVSPTAGRDVGHQCMKHMLRTYETATILIGGALLGGLLTRE